MKRGIGLFLLLLLVAAAGAAPAEETAGGVAVRETCEGRPKGSACWMGLADRPECYLWNPNLQPGRDRDMDRRVFREAGPWNGNDCLGVGWRQRNFGKYGALGGRQEARPLG